MRQHESLRIGFGPEFTYKYTLRPGIPPSPANSSRMSKMNAVKQTVGTIDIDGNRDNSNIISAAHTPVTPDYLVVLVRHCEAVWTQWVQLLQITNLSGCHKSSDPRVNTALRALDEAISGREGKLISRLAFVHLIDVFEKLERLIGRDRERGLLHRKAGYRNSSVAMDIYMASQPVQTNTIKAVTRRELHERKRIGRRWRDLAGPSPLLLLLYSENAEYLRSPSKRR